MVALLVYRGSQYFFSHYCIGDAAGSVPWLRLVIASAPRCCLCSVCWFCGGLLQQRDGFVFVHGEHQKLALEIDDTPLLQDFELSANSVARMFLHFLNKLAIAAATVVLLNEVDHDSLKPFFRRSGLICHDAKESR